MQKNTFLLKKKNPQAIKNYPQTTPKKKVQCLPQKTKPHPAGLLKE